MNVKMKGKIGSFCILLEHTLFVKLLFSHYHFSNKFHVSLWKYSGYPYIPVSA